MLDIRIFKEISQYFFFYFDFNFRERKKLSSEIFFTSLIQLNSWLACMLCSGTRSRPLVQWKLNFRFHIEKIYHVVCTLLRICERSHCYVYLLACKTVQEQVLKMYTLSLKKIRFPILILFCCLFGNNLYCNLRYAFFNLFWSRLSYHIGVVKPTNLTRHFLLHILNKIVRTVTVRRSSDKVFSGSGRLCGQWSTICF